MLGLRFRLFIMSTDPLRFQVLHSTMRCKPCTPEDPRSFMIKILSRCCGDVSRVEIMEHDKTECQAPEAPILCVNNCGFFGSAATMNMCSKCHKDLLLKQQQAKLVASSVDSTVSGSGSSSGKGPVVSWSVDFSDDETEPKTTLAYPSDALAISEHGETKVNDGPNRCNTCRKRVGLTGFTCRCGNLFCATHRYSDNHNCPFDYRTAGRDAIAKANPVVKAEKLDKI